MIAACLLAGGLKRLSFPGEIGFPLGEGGLFVLFSEEILRAGLTLPKSVTFGGQILPFGYPPAAFYLAAFAAKISGADLFTVYHVLPRFLNLLAIPAFCLMAARISRDRVVFAVASLLYVLMPESIVWQITGGGMPRSLAALFAILALATAAPISERQGGARQVILTGLLVGLAILSHLEWGLFAASGVTLLIATRLPLRRSAVLLPVIGVIALGVVLPWVLWILAQHGLAPFLSSMSGSSWWFAQFLHRFLAVNLFASTLTIPAILGVLRVLRTRDPFLAFWLPLILLLTPRMAQSAGLAIPTAILAGYGLVQVGEWVRTWLTQGNGGVWRARLPNLAREPAGFPVVVIALGLFFAVTLLSKVQWLYAGREQVEQLDPASREAMAWIREHTPKSSRFVLITPAAFWHSDRIAEWFPYLAARSSLTTAQGLEWAGPGKFTQRLAEIERLKFAQLLNPSLFPSYLQLAYCKADHVAVFLPPNDDVARALAGSPLFRPVHRAEDITVLRRLAPCPAPTTAETGLERHASGQGGRYSLDT